MWYKAIEIGVKEALWFILFHLRHPWYTQQRWDGNKKAWSRLIQVFKWERFGHLEQTFIWPPVLQVSSLGYVTSNLLIRLFVHPTIHFLSRIGISIKVHIFIIMARIYLFMPPFIYHCIQITSSSMWSHYNQVDFIPITCVLLGHFYILLTIYNSLTVC